MDLKNDLIKGADISSLLDVEEAGGKFYDTGCRGAQCAPAEADLRADVVDIPEQTALDILAANGVNFIRLRLWYDPYDEDGTPYGAGTNDLPRTMELARRCKALGLPWMLDFHYSDFWADPGKQLPPKAWAGLNAERLARAVYKHTFLTLTALKNADLLPVIVAPGNELSNGLLWPLGKVPQWSNIARFISAGIRAVHAVDPSIKTMIHLDNGGWYGMYRSWFDSYRINGGADFDYIGLSYYPFWHGPLEDLRDNMHKLAGSIGKPMIVTETSMAFTQDECCAWEGLRPEEKKGLASHAKNARPVQWPCTPEGQCAFLRDLCEVIRSVPNGLGRGFVWWEPAWLPVPGAEWAKPAGLAYVHEPGPGGNEWANQALFDYDGNALPALREIAEL